MGRTIPSYRAAVEHEISNTWTRFAKMLRREERASFIVLVNKIRRYASQAGAVAFPSVVDGMFLSALFAHTKELEELKHTIERVRKVVEQLKDSRLDP